MQIFSASLLFFATVVGLAYMPGKLLLHFLRRTVSPLEDISLACWAGLLISGFAYWLFAFLHQERFYVLWPLAIAALFVSLHARTLSKLPDWFRRTDGTEGPTGQQRDWSGLLLLGIIGLGVTMLALLPQYYNNLTLRNDGSMKVHAVPDVFFHLAIANELTHSIPPQAPVFAGRPLNYHYGMDLIVAMFAKATGLATPDLLLRLVPTLFLTLSILSVYCFARAWLKSGYFGALVAFLVFFGEDFSFLPGVLLGEKGDWSVRFFNVPTVLSLFYTNAMLPAVGLLFAGLFCLHRYLREHVGTWLFLSALLFVGLVEVKLFTAVHIMFCLGIGAIVYALVFRKTDLFKVAALTGILTVPLVLSVFFHNRSGADFITAFAPWPYVSIAMTRFGLKGCFTNPLAFTGIALPLYIIGCLGLRVIAVPTILKTIFRPDGELPLRFVLALFVVIGAVITLTCRIVPAGSVNAYNNSVWFLAQSKYIAWLFAVEVLQRLHMRLVFGGARRAALVGIEITAAAMALSVPATIQHFALELDPQRIYGKSVETEVQGYSKELLGVIQPLINAAQPGAVVLPDDTLLGPVLALTKCRVPVGFFSNFLVSRDDFMAREKAEKDFWKAWGRGEVQSELLREAKVRYIVFNKRSKGIPSILPASLAEVFSNSECALFEVKDNHSFPR